MASGGDQSTNLTGSGLLGLRVFDCHGVGISVEVTAETAVGELKQLVQTCFAQSSLSTSASPLPSYSTSDGDFHLSKFKQHLHPTSNHLNAIKWNAFRLSSVPFAGASYATASPSLIPSGPLKAPTSLVCVRQHRQLHEGRSVKEECLQNGDSLLFLPKLLFSDSELRSDSSNKTLSSESIALATKDLPHKNLNHCVSKPSKPSNVSQAKILEYIHEMTLTL
jgi:hypothetical protein